MTQKSPQIAKISSGQLGRDIGMTRATMDQKRRKLRVLLKEKQERILHLKHCCEKIAADVNNQFEVLTEK